MVARQNADPAKTRDAVRAVEGWLRDDTQPSPSRAELAAAVRLTARTLAAEALATEECTATTKPWVMARTIERGVSTRRGWPGIAIGRA